MAKDNRPANKILIVEDEPVVAFDLAQKLRSFGFEVCDCTDGGEDAVMLARSLRPDLVLMDIRLRGEIDGIEAARLIRQDSDIPVVYLTAHGDGATLERAAVTEPLGYLVKPFEKATLESTIRMALYKRESERKQRENEVLLREQAEQLAEQLARTREAEQALARSNKALKEFTAMVTHDLRSPLSGVLFAAEFLAETLGSAELAQSNQTLETIIQSLRRMIALVEELHGQALSGGRDLDACEVDLDQILQSVRQRFEPLLQRTGGQIRVERPLPLVWGDPAMLEQLFCNLIENALKYRGSEPPLIRVDAASDLRLDRVVVSDNGRGIPEKDRELIFKAYERGSSSKSTEGSGLGLALCRKIMEAHGGSIDVSTSAAGGAAFELVFRRVMRASSFP